MNADPCGSGSTALILAVLLSYQGGPGLAAFLLDLMDMVDMVVSSSTSSLTKIILSSMLSERHQVVQEDPIFYQI